MPISICENEEQLNNWCQQFAKKGRYTVYYTTDDYEVVLEPIKTTRPIRYCYLKLANRGLAEKVAKEIAQSYGLDVVELKGIAWDIEKGPWIKIPIKGE